MARNFTKYQHQFVPVIGGSKGGKGGGGGASEDPNSLFSTDIVFITNGLGELDLKSHTIQAIASLNFPIINIYGGFGYIGGSSSLSLSGRYELQYQDGLVNYTRILNDPLNLDYDVSGFTTTVGARLSLGFFKIFGSYTLQEFNTYSAGIAFSIR